MARSIHCGGVHKGLRVTGKKDRISKVEACSCIVVMLQYTNKLKIDQESLDGC